MSAYIFLFFGLLMDSEQKRAANTREANLIENNLEKSASVDPLTLAFNLPGEDDHLRAPWSHRSERQHSQEHS